MLTLEINNQQLNTSDDFSAQIEDQNPATKFDEIPGSKAIGIELPINDTNRVILQNPERFEKMGSVNDRRFTGAALRHFGQIIHKGTLVVDEATSKSYSAWLRDIVGNLAERVAGKFINQTTLGGEKTFENKVTYDPATDDYACPKIFNRAFWRDKGKRSNRTMIETDLEGNEYNTEEEDGELTWQFFEQQSFLVNNPDVGGVVTGGTDNAPVVSPMLFLWRAIELILSDNYIFVKENFLKDDAVIKKLILYNNFNIIGVSLITDTKILYYQHPYMPYVIYGEETEEEVIVATTYATTAFKYENLLPKISIGKLILSTQNLLNVIFSFNDLNECRIVDRQKLITEPAFDIDEYMTGEWELGERKNVTVKLSQEHDPQDAYFSDQWQDLSDLRQNISEPVQQKTDLPLEPEMDEIRLVESENRYYQYHWYVISQPGDNGTEEEEDVLGWEMISIAFQPYFYNDGDKEMEEIKTAFSTIQQSDNGYSIVFQKGNSKAFHSQHEAFTPRLLFYEGNDAASYHTSTLSLDYDGELGLAAKRWNYWLPFWANRLPAQAIFKFPASVFYYIKNNKAILPLRTRHGSFIIDKIEAIASKADMIETRLHVFKRESVVGYEEGTVPGGEETPPVTPFTPVYVGVTSTGKPYLVNSLGDVRIAPAWETLSPAPFAKSVCIDYDPVNKLLFVGGYSGRLHITDLSDVDDIQMKTIFVFSGGNVSSVRYLNGVILVGRDASNQVYVQPHYTTLAGYDSGQASFGSLINGYTAKDFLYHSGYYYSCSQAGEIHATTNPAGTWIELGDWKADLRKMVATDTKLIAFGKDDNHADDRDFYALKSSPTNWHEIDVESTGGIYVSDAVAYSSDRALIVTNKEYGGLKILKSDNTTTHFTPPLAKTCAGLCLNESGSAVVAIQEGNGTTKIAYIFAGWQYINVPELFWKLFAW